MTCFAFSKTGLRCMGEAGHTGNHHYIETMEWTDDECWQPGGGDTVLVPVIKPPMLNEQRTAKRCFACGHPWHDETCPRDCGCQTAVE